MICQNRGRDRLFTCAFSLFLCSMLCCNQNNSNENLPHFAPECIPAIGRLVPQDSITPLQTTAVGPIFVGPSCRPLEVPAYTNIQALSRPEIMRAGLPTIAIPGQNGLTLPIATPAIDRPVAIGIPETSIAKDAHISDHNPGNFSSFSVLQGLKHIQATCLLLDQLGCLWIGTDGGGLCRYDGKQFITYTDQTGLCGNNISSIFQDKQGNIWIGSWSGGISKFDGNYFTNYQLSEGFTDSPVIKIIQDHAKNLWFCSSDGVFKYDGKDFVHYTEKQGLLNNDVICALEDKKGNLWFGSAGGLSKFNGQGFYHYTDKNGLKANPVFSIREDKNGLLWLGSTGGLASTFDGRTFAHYQLNADFIITSILQDSKDNIWFASDGVGLLRLNTRHNTLTQFSDKQGLSNNFISDMLEDRTGTIWCSSLGGGVIKYAGNLFSHFTVAEGISSDIVFNVLNDRKSNLWFGTRGGGLTQLDRAKNVFRHYSEKDGLGYKLDNNSVFSLLEDQQGNIWCGTWGGGVSKFNGKNFVTYTQESGICGNDIRCIYQDRSGAIWFGSWNNGVSRLDPTGQFFTNYTTSEGLSHNDIKSIIEDQRGNIWIGTKGGGLNKLDQQRKTITHFTTQEGFFSDDVSGLVEDKSGQIWISSVGNGLIRLDQAQRQFTSFGVEEGLINNNILSLTLDEKDNLWLGTRGGLSKLSQTALRQLEKTQLDQAEALKQSPVLFKNYAYEDGFLGVSCYLGAIGQDAGGDIWVGASDRLTVYHPDGDSLEAQAPKVELSNISLFNESIPWALLAGKKDTFFNLSNGVTVGKFRFASLQPWKGVPEQLSLAHRNNFLSFHFIGIATQSPQKMRYQYKLEGIDANWSGLSALNEVPYGNLPPGNYTFKVRAMNGDGYWSKTLMYPFTIRPPWWKTWWAYLLYAGLFAAAVYVFIQYRTAQAIRKVKALEAIRTKISSDLHDDVGSILSGLAMQSQVMAYTAPSEIKTTLNELSDMSRDAMERMRDVVWVIDSRKDKYENLIDRMRIFAEKNLGLKNIAYHFELNNIDGKKFIDPEKRQNIYLIFKEAITNIVKHSDATQVNIVFEQEKGHLRLVVQDNGTHEEQMVSDGLGLSNMAMRAKNMGGSLDAVFENGFRVELNLDQNKKAVSEN